MELFRCERLLAELSGVQCLLNRRKRHPSCVGCDGLRQRVEVLRFEGEDAAIIRRFVEMARADGHAPETDLATVVGLFLDGKLRRVRGR